MIFSLFYLVVISIITYGWFSLKGNFVPDFSPTKEVSIIIAVRNEAENIEPLLESLVLQVYPKELTEIIIVDDHSGDATPDLVTTFIQLHPDINIKLLSSPGTGKKAAIGFGVKNAVNQFILTTDGDCVLPKWWVRKMTAYYQLHQPKILLAPVVYWNKRSLLHKFFMLDFLSLVASGAGSVGARRPLMGNGANMAFDKKVFSDEALSSGFASGDDVFLIHSVKKRFGSSSIHFLKDSHAVVKTQSPPTLSAFINQHIRWASKAKGYTDFWSILVSSSVLLFNLSIALLILAGLLWPWLLAIWFLFVTLKTLIDFPLINGYARLTGNTSLLLYLWPMEFLYPIYIVIAGVGSIFINYQWKGRHDLR